MNKREAYAKLREMLDQALPQCKVLNDICKFAQEHDLALHFYEWNSAEERDGFTAVTCTDFEAEQEIDGDYSYWRHSSLECWGGYRVQTR